MTINTDIAKTVKKQRDEATIEPVHAECGPVRAYAEWISQLKGEKHAVVTIPAGTAAHGMGYRYVSIPATELEYYLANGASLSA